MPRIDRRKLSSVAGKLGKEKAKLEAAQRSVKTALRRTTLTKKEAKELRQASKAVSDSLSVVIGAMGKVASLLSTRAPLKTVTKTRKAPRVSGVTKLPRQRKTSRQEEVIGRRELRIRGFWDRYTKQEHRKRPGKKKDGKQAKNKFAHIPKSFRAGPTAYDLLLKDYLKFTPAQRKRLAIRVVYGVRPDTGKLIVGADVERLGLVLYLPFARVHAMNALRTLLVRAGSVDTPTGLRDKAGEKLSDDGDDDDGEELDDEEIGVPLGIEWILTSD